MFRSVRSPLFLESFSILLALVMLLNSDLKAASCGDVDASDRVDISDAVYLVNYIFAGGGAPQDDAAGDLDCSGQFDISDAVLLVNYIFGSGPAPCNGPLCEIGLLLPGNEDSLAVSVLYDYGPIAADSAAIAGNGFLKTRLTALIHPQATIGAVNAALNAIGGTLTWMSAGDLMVTVAIAPVDSVVQADSIANLLIQSGAFLYAHAAHSIQPDAVVEFRELPPTGTSEIEHLIQMRMPAAWNVKNRAVTVNSPVTVMVPDGYHGPTPHPEIPSQSFLVGTGKRDFFPTSSANHGFATSGIIGAEHDNKNTSGVHPGPTSLLSIRSLMVGGLTPSEAGADIASHFPSGRFVLNTSLGFDVDIATYPKLERVMDALRWRIEAWSRQSDFIHFASAGNHGDRTDASRYAVLNSPFNIAAAFDSPFDVYAPGEATLIESFILQNYVNYLSLTNQFVNVRLTNIIVVGSSDAFGNEHSWSAVGAPVRALGEWVSAPCAVIDNPAEVGGCEQSGSDLISHYQGTSFSAPQVAGLAAYLLNLDPTLSNSEIKDLIQKSYDESPYAGFVDGYLAVLMLDDNIFNAPIRLTLLDVAHAPGVAGADGFFDEFDIQYLLDKFNEYELARLGIPNPPADHSRFDLNGDGFTGGVDMLTKFDLDINHPPALTSFSQQVGNKTRQFDELQISDLEILCYYSYTPMFSGTEAVRDSLLVDCPACDSFAKNGVCPNLWVIEADFPTFIQSSAPLQVRVGQQSDTGIVWRDGVEVQLLASGGSVAPAAGTTGIGGIFNAVGTIADGFNLITITISALEDSGIVAVTTVEASRLGVVIPTFVSHTCNVPNPDQSLYAASSSNFGPISHYATFTEAGSSETYSASSSSQATYHAGIDYDITEGTITFQSDGNTIISSQAIVLIDDCGDAIGIAGMVTYGDGFNQTLWQFTIDASVDSLPYTLISSTGGGTQSTQLGYYTARTQLSNSIEAIAYCESTSSPSSPICTNSVTGYLHGNEQYTVSVMQWATASAVLNPECSTNCSTNAQASFRLIIELPEAVKRNRPDVVNR